jgi:hypothetical protein
MNSTPSTRPLNLANVILNLEFDRKKEAEETLDLAVGHDEAAFSAS